MSTKLPKNRQMAHLLCSEILGNNIIIWGISHSWKAALRDSRSSMCFQDVWDLPVCFWTAVRMSDQCVGAGDCKCLSLSLFLSLSLCLSLCLSVCLFVCLSVCLSVSLSLSHSVSPISNADIMPPQCTVFRLWHLKRHDRLNT